MAELGDYPPGVQVMFRQAAELIERLDRMEMDYRAWQASEAGRAWEVAQQVDEPGLCAGTLLLLGTPSRAEQARRRWEARARAVGSEL